MPDPAPSFARDGADLTVVVVTYNTAHLVRRCVAALRGAVDGLKVRLVMIDNASRDGSAGAAREAAPDALVVENAQNVGFGRANNQALAHFQGRYLVLLNGDAFVEPDTLRRATDYLDAHPECGVLGVQSVDEAGVLTFAGRPFPTPGRNFAIQTGWFGGRALAAPEPPQATVIDCDWVVGCFYVVRREVIDRIGLFDPRFFLYYEEVDHCRRVHEAGYAVRCLRDVRVVHDGGGSARSEGALDAARQISAYQVESELLYFRKHGGLPGVLAAAGLSLLADLISGAKWLARGRAPSGLARFWRTSVLVCRLFVRTGAGRAPTR